MYSTKESSFNRKEFLNRICVKKDFDNDKLLQKINERRIAIPVDRLHKLRRLLGISDVPLHPFGLSLETKKPFPVYHCQPPTCASMITLCKMFWN